MATPDSDAQVGQTDDRSAEQTGDTGAARRGSPRRWIVWAVLGVVVLLVAIPVALTATPRQCASCHEMKPYYESWQASSHRGAAPSCLTCHTQPGILSRIGFEFGVYRMIGAHFAGGKVSTTAKNSPSVQSCRRSGCHSLNRETSNSGDIKINHRLHVVQANIACPKCHAGAVHAGVGGRTKLPPMKLCKSCHADKMSQCNYCHTQQHLQEPPGAH
jgi:hypothetical protein